MWTPRTLTRTAMGHATSDGAGVRLYRVMATPQVPEVDPFLLLDEFRSDNPGDYLAGFPDHPHRGFETVTYMLAGAMEHRDNMGNRGLLSAGDAQWMTAGSGIIHSEMPRQENGLMWGFQLWVNLPAAHKMDPPRYQDIPAADIPQVAIQGGSVRVVAGHFAQATGPVSGIYTLPVYLDVRLQAGASVRVPLPAGHQAVVYAYQGSGQVAEKPLETKQLGLLSTQGDGVDLLANHDGLRALVLAGKPLGEPIARQGPFVMNTHDQLVRAMQDYRQGTLVRKKAVM